MDHYGQRFRAERDPEWSAALKDATVAPATVAHTPGPWRLHPSGRANALDLYTVFHGHGETAHNQICQAEEANARLIAAAPDLLAACHDYVAHLERLGSLLATPAYREDAARLDRARAAIARATGGTTTGERT